MLRNNLELVIQYPVSQGYICRGFRNVALIAPAYVVFDGADIADQGVANALGEAFSQEILRYAGVQEEPNMPCNGSRSTVYCHAMWEATCRKIFVRVGATQSKPGATGTWPAPSAETIWLGKWPNPTWEVLPIMPAAASSSVSTALPVAWRGINVCFWTRHPVETLWAVMQRVGLAPEESRIFISYVRRDTTPVADQIFKALTNEGFDVFLDRCSVPVGVQFQERLMQDLSDKAMVVLLNSPSVANSHWVEEEIAIIKTYRLGLLELRFPTASKRADIDPDFTEEIDSATDLKAAGTHYAPGARILSAAKLRTVVARIKETHGRALHRRRYELIDSFAAALVAAGKSAQVLPDGTFVVSQTGTRTMAVIGVTPRPPELGDFCALHQRGSVSSTRTGWLISPAPFFLASRKTQVSWLGGLSNIKHVDEGQITQLAANI